MKGTAEVAVPQISITIIPIVIIILILMTALVIIRRVVVVVVVVIIDVIVFVVGTMVTTASSVMAVPIFMVMIPAISFPAVPTVHLLNQTFSQF